MLKTNEVLDLAKEAKKDDKKLLELISWFQSVARKRYSYYKGKSTVLDFDDFDSFVSNMVWMKLEQLDDLGNGWVDYTVIAIRNNILENIKVNSKLDSRSYIGEFFESLPNQLYSMTDDSMDDHYVFLIKELRKRLTGKRDSQLLRLLVSFPDYTHRQLAKIMKVHEAFVSRALGNFRIETKIILGI